LTRTIHGGEEVELPLEEGHHLARVLRRRPGDRVSLISQGGGLFDGQITAVMEEGEGLRVMVSVLAAAEARSFAPVIPWTAAVAVVKGEGFELALRMAVELGLEGFTPLWTARTVVQPRDSSRKTDRWERIVREASKQSKRVAPLELGKPRQLKDFLEESKTAPSRARKWVAVPSAPFRWKELAAELEEGGHLPLFPALFLVGPEGGLSPEEVSQAMAAGFEPIGFPTPILRTPTAVALISALGVVLASAGEGPSGSETGEQGIENRK
jgi:16S rRNA (uracil1498-N3)-methyltransferase